MGIKDVLLLVGIGLAIGVGAVVLVVLVAWFVLGWHTADQISPALFWSGVVVCGLLFLATPKHAYGDTRAEANLRFANHQFAGYLLVVLVGGIIFGSSALVSKIF